MPGELFGWVYGIVLVGFAAGMAVSGWRLRDHRRETPLWSLQRAAVVALIAGWPTGWRAQNDLLADRRDVASLVNDQTRPLLRALAAVGVPFVAVVVVFANDDRRLWVSFPLLGVALMLALATWVVDGRTRPAPGTPTT